MPRTSNLFITSPRAGSPPLGKMSCLDFNRDTPAWTSNWQGELQTSGETWQASDYVPSLLLFFPQTHFSCSTLQRLFNFPVNVSLYLLKYPTLGLQRVLLFHIFVLLLYLYPKLHREASGREDKEAFEYLACRSLQGPINNAMHKKCKSGCKQCRWKNETHELRAVFA